MGKYSRSITHATETSHDVLTIRCCLFASIYGERFSLELTDGGGGGRGGVMGSSILSIQFHYLASLTGLQI